MQTKKKIYYWAADISNNSGEGILANSFINHYGKENNIHFFKNLNFKDKYQKKNNFIKKKFIYESNIHKYIYPLIGIFILWKNFFKKRKICYINYLPLWNFLIFLFLPPKTILGPITGGISRKYSLLRMMDIFELVSLFIIRLRHKKVYFSHNFYNAKYNLNKKRFDKNFILKDFKLKKLNKKKRKYDLIIYFRIKSKLNKNYIINLLKEIEKHNLKFAVIGDKLAIKSAKNFGYISRKDANKVISDSKFAISNPENLYSYFIQDCLANHLKVFYNKIFKKFNVLNKNSLIPIEFTSYQKDSKIILKYLKKI